MHITSNIYLDTLLERRVWYFTLVQKRQSKGLGLMGVEADFSVLIVTV